MKFNLRFVWLLLIPLAILSLGCLMPHGPRALIRDGNPTREADKCEIIKVDGRRPERWHEPFVTVAPHVVVAPGVHKLELKWEDSDDPETIEVSIEPDKTYQFKKDTHGPTKLVVR